MHHRRRPAPDSQAIAQRFLELDADIRVRPPPPPHGSYSPLQLNAAAHGLVLPCSKASDQTRPGAHTTGTQRSNIQSQSQPRAHSHSPARECRKNETQANTDVSDPGDAQSLLARFERFNLEKNRSMTIAASDPSPASPAPSSSVYSTPAVSLSGGRVFPFPSMKRQTTLENFIEMESSANETGKEDPLALQSVGYSPGEQPRRLGRSVGGVGGNGSRASSREAFGSASMVDLNTVEQSEAQARGKERRGRDLHHSTPQAAETHMPSWLRATAAAAGSSTNITNTTTPARNMDASVRNTDSVGPRNERERERNVSFSASRDSLRSFVFPALAPLPQPEPELETVVEVQVQSPVHTQIALQSQTPVRAQFQVRTQSPYHPPQTPIRNRRRRCEDKYKRQYEPSFSKPRCRRTRCAPYSDSDSGSASVVCGPGEPDFGCIRFPSGEFELAGWWESNTYRASPTAGYRASPTAVHRSSPSVGYRASPMTAHRDSPTHRATASDAHINLYEDSTRCHLMVYRSPRLTGLARLTSSIRRARTCLADSRFISPHPKRPNPERGRYLPATKNALASCRDFFPTSSARAQSSCLSSAPDRQSEPSACACGIRGSPSLSYVLARPRTDSCAEPVPPRLRHHTNASSHPSDASSDEVVFKSSSSASSTPAKRRRSRPRRLHMRANSEGIVRRTMSEGVRSKRSRRPYYQGSDASQGPTPPANKTPSPPAVVVDVPSVVVHTTPVPPPLIRKESIPLPVESQIESPQEPANEAVQSAAVPPSEPVRKQSFEPLQRPILQPPSQPRQFTSLPWSPPARLRREVVSREGSFHTAPDSFDIDTDAEFPSSVPESTNVNTPAHMDLSEPEEMHSAEDGMAPRQDAPERVTISSAMRGHVAQPAILTRQASGEFITIAPTPPRSATPARRSGRRGEGVLAGAFHTGFLVPPMPMPSPPSSGDSHTPHSPSNNNGRIPMRHEDRSPPSIEHLPRSVTPRTEVSVRHPDEDSFHSAHTAEEIFHLPLDDWLEFAMGSMAAMGIPLTRSALEDLHESEGEGMADVISASSRRGFREEQNGGILDGASQPDEDSSDSLSRCLSDIATPPSVRSSPDPSTLFSGPGYAGMTTVSSMAPESTGTRPTTIRTDLGYSPEHNQPVLTANSATTAESESERAVESLQNIATVVREMNLRTPIPSASSSRPPQSASTSLPMHTPFSGPGSHVGPPSFVGPPPMPGAYQDYPTRALSPGSVSITFRESTPASSSVPPLVVPPEDRDRFADSLLQAEYQHQRSFQHLRDDDYRALDDGEDVVLYGIGGEWERVESRVRTASDETTGSGVPIDLADYDPASGDLQSQRKYTQFLLSFANALRTPNVNRPQRWVEVALRTLRGPPGTRPRYPSSLYDAISRAEAGVEVPPAQPVIPGTLSSTFVTSSSASTPKSSSIGSALPEDDEVLEEFVRSVLTPAPPTPPRAVTPIRTDVTNTNAIPWPALASPISPRYRLPPPRSSSRQTSLSQVTSSSSGYSSLIPPPPRVRPRSIEPHWLAVYMARRWAFAQNQVTRRTYSSPSALGPPMPYHWRPICHISPERLWEITNLAVRVDMPPPVPPPALSNIESVSPVELTRPHYTTPATTYGRATPYSARTASSHRSGRTTTPVQRPLSELIPVAESASRMTSHPNLPIDPSHHSIPLPASESRTSVPLIQRPLGPQYSPRPSADSDRPALTSTAAVTPAPAAVVQRKRTVRDIVGRLVGKERTRVRSVSSRTPSPLVKSRFGVAGRIVEGVRRAFRYPRRRTRVSSIRSQRA
ncbi:mucin-5AC [Ceratobasidium sp. AG-Ba]|nr:mucin-5AC [Ceratobasidium sp. AG-Ba]